VRSARTKIQISLQRTQVRVGPLLKSKWINELWVPKLNAKWSWKRAICTKSYHTSKLTVIPGISNRAQYIFFLFHANRFRTTYFIYGSWFFLWLRIVNNVADFAGVSHVFQQKKIFSKKTTYASSLFGLGYTVVKGWNLQCSASGSLCFWASWIQIRDPSFNKNKLRKTWISAV
jgi:hypothetical protein